MSFLFWKNGKRKYHPAKVWTNPGNLSSLFQRSQTTTNLLGLWFVQTSLSESTSCKFQNFLNTLTHKTFSIYYAAKGSSKQLHSSPKIKIDVHKAEEGHKKVKLMSGSAIKSFQDSWLLNCLIDKAKSCFYGNICDTLEWWCTILLCSDSRINITPMNESPFSAIKQ